MNLIFRAVAVSCCLTSLVPVTLPAQQQDREAVARRIATIISIAVDEYALGVAAGGVTAEAELAEARLFLTEARELAARLPDGARERATSAVIRLIAALDRLEDPAVLRREVEALRSDLAARLQIALDPLPRSPPSRAEAAGLYHANCAKCHGLAGAGDGPRARELELPPADLTDRAARGGSSPLDFFRKISVGIAGTDMPAFEEGLTADQRWALALYASGFRFADVQTAGADRWLVHSCPECRILISGMVETAALSDDSLRAVLSQAAGTDLPPGVLAFARTAASREVLGRDRRLEALRVTRRVEAHVAVAAQLGAAGDVRRAGEEAFAAYLVFEEIERAVAARNGRAARAVEQAFAQFRGALQVGARDAIDIGQVDIRDALGRAVDVMTGDASPLILFWQSLLILVREGLEAILIVGALMTFLTRAGASERNRDLALGVVLAIVASLLTAAAFATLLGGSTAQREAIEGITMLVASAVLFSVASWMVSKVEADRWKSFVGQTMRRALASKRSIALVGVAFLAVYREGFETVLFYGALFSTAESAGGGMAISIGLVVGASVLAVAFFSIHRFGVRVPLKMFFATTGVLLTIMSVSFAGQGVAELQTVGWVPLTPLNLPSLPALGVFPTVQTLAAQLAVTAAFAGGLAWIFLVRPRPAASALPQR
ncbi:MAG TPA: cytochrome c/FTR1 family iron permease [Gemmatimonadales bacterium]